MSESFYDKLIITRKEYDRKLRAEYDRGYQDGLSKQDTETWQLDHERSEVVTRLKANQPSIQLDTSANVGRLLFAIRGTRSEPRDIKHWDDAYRTLIRLLSGDMGSKNDPETAVFVGKPQKVTNRDAKTKPSLQKSPKTINREAESSTDLQDSPYVDKDGRMRISFASLFGTQYKEDPVPECTGSETLDHERGVVIQRLREVPFDGLDSHHNLSAIANAVWGSVPVAWTQRSCTALARRLMWLLGAEDEPAEPTADELRGAIAFGLAEAGLEDLCDKFDRLMELLGGEDG